MGDITVTAFRAPTPRIGQFIKSYEKCVLHAFKPTPDDVWTIGWGYTDHVVAAMVWTQAFADQVFATDLAARGIAIAHMLQGARTSQVEFDALASLSYNIGVAGLDGSTLLKYHLAGRHDLAALEFPKWNHQAGKVLNGLTERRLRERNIYSLGLYQDHDT